MSTPTVTGLQNKIAALIAEHNARVLAMDRNYASLEKELTAARSTGGSYDKLQDRIRKLEKHVAELAEGIELKEGEAEELTGKNTSLERSLMQAEADADQTTGMMREMSEEASTMHGQLVEKEKIIQMQSMLLLEKDKKMQHLQDLADAYRAERGSTVQLSMATPAPRRERGSLIPDQTPQRAMSRTVKMAREPPPTPVASDRITELRRQLDMARLERERMQRARADRERAMQAGTYNGSGSI